MKQFEELEIRRLMAFDIPAPVTDLSVDSNRDGQITGLDDSDDSPAIVLPNLDRDNTNTDAPDNWIGGNWNGTNVGPNNVIDNAADLQDIAKLRLAKLVNIDASFVYEVVLRVLPSENDPAWLKDVPAQDRVRVFMPSKAISDGRVVCQPGDSAVIGPGIGDRIKFVYSPKHPNEFPLSMLAGDGFLAFGVEGLKMGADVRFALRIQYHPVIAFNQPASPAGLKPPPFVEMETLRDEVAMRVAPFVLQNHTRAIDDRNRSIYVDEFAENEQLRETLADLFGDDKLIIGHSGDIWQQDGSEIGYAQAPYGAMPIVLELPRSRGEPFTGGTGMRSFIREKLLRAGVGVCTEVANFSMNSSSASGGDIESIGGYLVRSKEMPVFLKQFFDAQGVNPPLELTLDTWLGVGHVDEVVHLSSDGEHVFMADVELGWAMLLWASQLNPDARMHAGFGEATQMPSYNDNGAKLSDFLDNGRLRALNLLGIMSKENLPAAQKTIRDAFGLTREISKPVADESNTGTLRLRRGGAFTQFLGDQRRFFEVRFVNSNRYELRYRDEDSNDWSAPIEGRRSRDEIFAEARAFILANQWSGEDTEPEAGDVFTFHTNPDATLVKLPVLFANGYTFATFDGEPPDGFDEEAIRQRSVAFTSNIINSLTSGEDIVVAENYGPKVKWDGTTRSDIFRDYVEAGFEDNGYEEVHFVDARFYHNGSGGVHCGTNIFRAIPDDEQWWETEA